MVLSILQATHNIEQYLKEIDFLEQDNLIFNLYEYLKFELYGIDPCYAVECEEDGFRIPKHFKYVLREITNIIKKGNKEKKIE
jgi:hypothetical protein